MGISDAFLRGQQVATQAQNQKLGLLNALIRRPMTRGPAIRMGGGGGGSAMESFEDQEARQAAEARKASKERRTEEAHNRDMERGELESDILGQALSERETTAAYKAEDRAKAAAEDVVPSRIRNKAAEDAEAYQEQMRHYRAYSDAIYRGDATAADRHFKGIYPGMGETSRTSVTRQKQPMKDEQGNPILDEQGNPVLGEMKQQYDAEGNPISEEQQQAKQMGYPKHRTDGGVVSVQFGDSAPVPVGSSRLRQILMSVNQKMMQPVGGGAGGTATGEKISTKDQSVIMKNNISAGKSAMEAALKYAEGIPVELAEGEEHDSINPKPKSAQQHQRDFLKGMGVLQKMVGGVGGSKKLANQYGLTGKNFLTPQAAQVAAGRVREMFNDQAGKKPDLRMIMQSGLKEYGPAFAYHMAKEFKAELTPVELEYNGDGSPKITPDLGKGSENVVTYYHKDIGKGGTGFAIDKDMKQLRIYNRTKDSWASADKSETKAYFNILQTMARDGDEKAQEIIQLLEAERMTPFSLADLLKPIGKEVLRAGSAIADALKEEPGKMKRWADGGRPQGLQPKQDISNLGPQAKPTGQSHLGLQM